MKILVTGASGLVGSRYLELSKYKNSFLAPDYHELDITNQESLKLYFSENPIDVVVNFAAFTDVGAGENERGNIDGLCWKLNVEAIENILSVLSPSTHFVQISTDMVFSGSEQDPGPYPEDHEPEKNVDLVTWYGWTKAEGERRILNQRAGQSTILRLIYPVRAHYDLKPDYLRKPLNLYDEGKLYPLFTDQQISISFIDEISQVLDNILTQKAFGIFHVSSRDTGSPFEMVSYLLEKSRGVKNAVQSASLKEFLKTVDTPVRYPEYGGLKVTRTEEKLAIKYSSWQEIIDQLVAQGIK